MSGYYGRDDGNGSGPGDEWTLDLEELIRRQTMQEAELEEPGTDPGKSTGGYEDAAGRDRADAGEEDMRRSDRYRDDEYEEDEDGALFDSFDEEDEDDDTDRHRRGRKKRSSGHDRAPKESRKERRRSKREQKEYEEFQAYRKAKKKRKRHRVRGCLVTLLIFILLLYAMGTIALRLLGIQTSLSGVGSFNDGVADNAAMSGYTNIALFGVDSRDEDLGEGNRTDVMIIASIDNSTGDIRLVSVYRDTYLDIGDGDYQKANAAYAYGGASQAVTMLNTNLDLNITDYVTIGFAGVADLIDAVGGVEIDVTEEEISHLNNYQSTMAEELGMEYVEVTSTGTQTLNGLQAVAYCRIRYTDGGDFQRTERQKEVLTQAFDKLTSSGPLTILQAASDLSDEIETSLSTSEIAGLALKAFTYDISDTSGFPNEDQRTTGYIGDASCVIPITLATNVTWLHEYLFGDTDYEPSETVQAISEYVSAVSGYDAD